MSILLSRAKHYLYAWVYRQKKKKSKKQSKIFLEKHPLKAIIIFLAHKTGPLIGFKGEGLFSFDLKGISERKYSLKNNFEVDDVTPGKIVYLPQ